MLRGLTIALALSSAAGFVPGSRRAPVAQRRQSASTVKMLGGGSGEPPKGDGILPGLNTQEGFYLAGAFAGFGLPVLFFLSQAGLPTIPEGGAPAAQSQTASPSGASFLASASRAASATRSRTDRASGRARTRRRWRRCWPRAESWPSARREKAKADAAKEAGAKAEAAKKAAAAEKKSRAKAASEGPAKKAAAEAAAKAAAEGEGRRCEGGCGGEGRRCEGRRGGEGEGQGGGRRGEEGGGCKGKACAGAEAGAGAEARRRRSRRRRPRRRGARARARAGARARTRSRACGRDDYFRHGPFRCSEEALQAFDLESDDPACIPHPAVQLRTYRCTRELPVDVAVVRCPSWLGRKIPMVADMPPTGPCLAQRGRLLNAGA